MCGIAGIAGLPQEQAKPQVERMNSCMQYRGPDDEGVWCDDTVCFGHLRLSIIDTSNAGHQPMFSHDRRFVIIFNGEIFNYLELREELKAAGSTFATAGDTEVIMEAYRQWGEKAVARFNGMWAFALWDTQEKLLFASRDRFGVKPFYYTFENGVLSFGSEMKSLLTLARHAPDWHYYYHFFDRKTPLGTDRTVFAGIQHLRPGHTLVWKNGEMNIQRYWKPDPSHSQSVYSYTDPVGTFRELLTSAVKLRLRSDVPVGVCLSGGIDSSAITVLLASMGVVPETFSTVYEEQAYSEAQYIDAVNAQTGATSHRVTPRSEDFFAVMDKIVAHHDEPVRMPGVYSHWHVMQCADGHVTVLLDGQGADEVVGGYREYFPAYLASLMRDVLTFKSPGDAMAQVRACLDGIETNLGGARAYLMEALLRTIPQSVRAGISRGSTKGDLFTEKFAQRYSSPLADYPEVTEDLNRLSSVLDREMYKTFTETNLPMLLRYEDRNSMAFSMEARTPFLDYRLVEYCLGLSYRYKMRGYTTKWILREALKDMLPREVYERKDKKGFPTPTAEWFRGPLKDEVRKRLSDASFVNAGIINPQTASRLVEEHIAGKANHERTIFRMLTLDLWLRQHGITSFS